MISPHHAFRTQRLHRSTAIVPLPKATLSPSALALTQVPCHRSFSWGSRHKVGNKNAGKVWKGFSTHENSRRKHIYRSTFWDHQVYSQPVQPHVLQGPRLSSTWGRSCHPSKQARNKAPYDDQPASKTHGDWYNEYQEKKRQQYDIFMKKMEADPIGMLFGRTWADWVEGAEAKMGRSSAAGHSDDKGDRWVKQNGNTSANTPDQSFDGSGAEKHPEDRKCPQTNDLDNQGHSYDIDPITNRKVSRLSRVVQPTSSSSPESTKTPSGYTETIEIPIKRFVSARSEVKPESTALQSPKFQAAAVKTNSSALCCESNSQPWLAKEGFGGPQQQSSEVHPAKAQGYSASRAATSKIESSLDRHLKESKVPQDIRHPTLQYNDHEERTDDVDLLRSSDVRASAGLRGKSAKEHEGEREKRYKELEQSYESCSKDRERQLHQEMTDKSTQQGPSLQNPSGQIAGDPHLQAKSGINASRSSARSRPIVADSERTNQLSEAKVPASEPAAKESALHMRGNDKVNKIKAQIVPLKARLDIIKADYDALRQRWLDEKRRQGEKAAKKIRVMHDAEVNAQKVAMEAIENRGTRGEKNYKTSLANEAQKQEVKDQALPKPSQIILPGEGDLASNVHEFAKREGWYKRKAPHADNDTDAKLKGLANDESLAQELKSIYEETYGCINTPSREFKDRGDALPKSDATRRRDPFVSSTVTEPPTTPRAAASDSSSSGSIDPSAQANNFIADTKIPTTIQDIHDQLRKIQFLLLQQNNRLDQIEKPFKTSVPTDVSNLEQPMRLAVTYCILAYDSTRQDLFLSQTTSRAPGHKEQAMSLTEALAAIDKPGKFLTDLVRLHDDGYVIVTATRDTVVLKKPSAHEKNDGDLQRHADYVKAERESTVSPLPSEETRSRIKGDVRQMQDAETVTPAPKASGKEDQQGSTSSGNKIRREEAVFSGSSGKNWQATNNLRATKGHKRGAKGVGKVKHVIVTGTITAACCYAVGVVSQMMQ